MHRNQVDYKDVNNKQTLSDIQNKTRTGRKYLWEKKNRHPAKANGWLWRFYGQVKAL